MVLHATAAGRVWLTTLDVADATRLVKEHGFAVPARFNRQAFGNEKALGREIEATRKRGYGLAIEEGEAGTVAIACAIHASAERSGRGVGAITVAGPTSRLTDEKIAKIIDDVRAAARDLSAIWPVRQFASGAASPKALAAASG